MALLETLTDDFSAGSIGAQWTTTSAASSFLGNSNNASITVVQGSGVLTVTDTAAAGTGGNGLISVSTYDMTNSVCQVKVSVTASDGNYEAVFIVGFDPSNWYAFDISGGTLYVRSLIAGVQTDYVTPVYSASTMAWLRLRHGTYASGTAGHVYWDTAPDSSGSPGAWTNQHDSATAGFAVTAVKANLVVQSYVILGSTCTTVYDSVNLLAPTSQISHVTSIVANASTWTDQVGSSVNADLVTALDDSVATYIKSPGNPAGSGPITIHTGPLSKPNAGDRNFVIGLQKSANTGTMDYTVECKKSGGASVQTFNKDASAGATLVAALGNVASTGGTATCTVTNAIADGDWANGFDWVVTPNKSA